ncbi:MAG: hypothetical protein Q8K30_03590 [Candidatus Gracilibacteria bacterium]|nr:hypothetical protein [Candidatus Gracilibacteria bacterium]
MKKQLIRTFVMGITFFIGLCVGYLALFATLDWSNLTTNVTNGTPLTPELWNNNITNIKNNIDNLSNSVDNLTINGGKYGTVVTVWGRTTAPTGSNLLYAGRGFGGHYTHANGSRVCLKGGDAGGNTGAYGDLLYPLTTGDASYMPPGIAGDKNIMCSKVYVNSTTFETYGTDICPTNWTVLYKGYSMGNYYTHSLSNDNPICVDGYNFETNVSYAGVNGSYMVGSRVWGSSDTGSYPTGKFVKCAVCYKQ